MSFVYESNYDAETISKLLATAMPGEAISATRFLRQVVLDPNFDRAGSWLALDENDEPVGYALAMSRRVPIEGDFPDPDRGYVTLLAVAPAFRGQGIGSRLLELCERYLQDKGKKTCLISSYSPGYFAPGVDVDACADGLEFLKHRGYVEVYRPIAMETSIWDLVVPEYVAGAAPDVKLVNEVERFDFPVLFDFIRAEFGPDWVRFARESALRQLNGDRRTGLVVALENHVPVGFAHFDGERFGPVGVAASQRGRGVGMRLMFEILSQQRDRGYRVSWFLWSDDRTAERLYSHAGFRIVRRFALLKKELS